MYAYEPGKDVVRFAALGVFLVACVSDGLDGYIARHWNQRTALGTRLDPLVDKLLMSLGFVFLAANRAFDPGIPLWFPVLVVARDTVIVAGAALITQRRGRVEVRPSLLGKTNTVLMMGLLVAALMNFTYTHHLMYAVLCGAILSFYSYVRNGWQQAEKLKTQDTHGQET